MIKNPDKDIDEAIDCSCVGVDLIAGKRWSAPGPRLWSLLDAVLDLAAGKRASPGAVAAVLGVAQWYDLLRRLRLSVFNRVYDFASGAKARDWSVVDVSVDVISELLLDTILAPFGVADMSLSFLSLVGCTDASTSYGHGGAVAALEPARVKEVARLAVKRGGFVHLGDGPDLTKELEARLGRWNDLGLELRDVDVIFSVEVDDPDHINLEEAKALLLFVKWVLRSAKRFSHRIVVLVDSKVVVGAVTKGRSPSFPLNRLLQRLAALCFAGGLVLHCVFIPTAHNPSDWPSQWGPKFVAACSLRSLRGAAPTATLSWLRHRVRQAPRSSTKAFAWETWDYFKLLPWGHWLCFRS